MKLGEMRNILDTIKDKTDGMNCRVNENKIDDLEKKINETSCREHSAKIDLHEKSIDKMDCKYDKIFEELAGIKAVLVAKEPNQKADMFKTKSPLSLTQKGTDFVNENHIEAIVDNNWQNILDVLGELNTNPYDIQLKIFEKCYINMDKLVGDETTDFLKRYSFNTGEPFTTVGTVVGLVIRDKYFKEKNIDVSEIDTHDPSKA
jgi:hypothetical protein